MKGRHIGCNPELFSSELIYSNLVQCLNLVFKDIAILNWVTYDKVIEIVVQIISFPIFFRPLAL